MKALQILIATLLLCVNAAYAQQPEMADAMRAEGKIYVVVAIVLAILAGFILYLFLLDKKLNRLEKQAGIKK